MSSLARWCFRKRRLVVFLWILALVVIGGLSQAIGSSYNSDFNLPNTESQKATQLLTSGALRQGGDSDTIVFHATTGSLDDQSTASAIDAMLAKVTAMPHVASVGNFSRPGSGQLNADRTIGFVTVQFDQQSQQLPAQDVKNVITTAQSIKSSRLQVELGGDAVENASGRGPGGNSSELIGLLAAAVVLFLAFGSIYTMFLPLLTALLALGTGLSIVGFLTHAVSIASFGPTLAALIGLGVGIDYALFIVSRHRVNLQKGDSPEQAAITAIDTSGRAVLFAGITVCIGMLGLFLLGVSFLYGLALATVVAVVLTMLAALTFLPAMLGFVGLKALSRKQQKVLQSADGVVGDEELSQGWFRWAKTIQRHPVALGTVAIIVMLTLAIPVLSIRLGTTDAGGDPKGTTTREAYDLLTQGFGPGFNGPLQLVAKTSNGDVSQLNNVLAQIKTQPNVASVTPAIAMPAGNLAIAQIYAKTSPQSSGTTKLIDDLRSQVTHPYNARTHSEIYIGGQAAVFHDFTKVLADKLPLFVGVVIGLSFLLLMTVFRSLLIPLVASLMNLLSAGAAFGIVVAVFQWGWGASYFGIEQTGPIMAFLPVIAFAILFGLSMDYEVFLVSRMYEEWHKTHDNDTAVALGQAETGRVITAAAAIMVLIFGSFVFGGESTIKLFGISLASAVFLDALIVRTILVPALMNLADKSNWYLPAWLDRILPRLNVEAPANTERTVQ